MIIMPDVGAKYQHRRSRRSVTVVAADDDRVRLATATGHEFALRADDFWLAFRHRGIVRARAARWEASCR